MSFFTKVAAISLGVIAVSTASAAAIGSLTDGSSAPYVPSYADAIERCGGPVQTVTTIEDTGDGYVVPVHSFECENGDRILM